MCVGWSSLSCWMWVVGGNICNICHECDGNNMIPYWLWLGVKEGIRLKRKTAPWTHLIMWLFCRSFCHVIQTQLNFMSWRCTVHAPPCSPVLTPQLNVLHLFLLCPWMNRQFVIEQRILSYIVLVHQLCIFCEAVKRLKKKKKKTLRIPELFTYCTASWTPAIISLSLPGTKSSLWSWWGLSRFLLLCTVCFSSFSTPSHRENPILKFGLMCLFKSPRLIGLDPPSRCQSLIICSMLELCFLISPCSP